MIHIQSPTPLSSITLSKKVIFLAGSIEQGTAQEWQKEALELLKNYDAIVLNPRCAVWDDSIENSIHNTMFREQVEWELKGLEVSDIILMYFDPNTKSPISLLELGAFYQKTYVVCPEGFWRKGNVDIFCERYSIPQFYTLEHVTDYIINQLKLTKIK